MFKLTLKAVRYNSGLSRPEAAKYFDVHPATLMNYENNSSKVPRSFVVKLEKVYGIPLEYIFFGKETDFVEEKRKERDEKLQAV